MAAMLETPSRVWRRIEAIQDRDMPSLPSLPGFDEEDSLDEGTTPSRVIDEDTDDDSLSNISSPMHSTPTATHHTHTLTMHAPPSAGSTARFAHSIASRSSKSSIGPTAMRSQKDSFDITDIPSLSAIPRENTTFSRNYDKEQSSFQDPGVYLPDDDNGEQDYSISDALQSVSRSGSPPSLPASKNNTPKSVKGYEHSVSLKSEPKASPFDKYRNVAMRKTLARTRTPSLSRTTSSSSQSTSPSASTPKSNNSLKFAFSDAGSEHASDPRSANASPAQQTREASQDVDRSHESNDTGGSGSMDITDIHISPQRVDATDEEESESGVEGQPQFNEPTFSSEGDNPSPAFSNRTAMPLSMPSPNNAASSAAPSFAMTPTPAFPRPRARFEPPNPPTQLFQTPAPKPAEEDDDLVTPHTRRKSFLLSVINSTARPRLKLGTPHPRQFVPETPLVEEESVVEETPRPIPPAAPTPISRVPFAELTPRPRAALTNNRRMSHPLSQAITATPSTSDAESLAGSKSGGPRAPVLKPWATPMQGSPYDGAADKASFISTASSHDLTTHHRVNTSFDPAMGFGAAAQGHGVGRFNAGKLNNYLHGLNRRLQEENEALLARVRRLEEDRKADLSEVSGNSSSRRSSGVHRRLSAVGGGGLDNVQEEVDEGWLEEKAQLEEMVEAFKEEVETCMAEKEEVERELEKEKEERKRDQERWKERMVEAEEGVAAIITELEKKAEAAESKVAKAGEGLEQDHKELERELEDVREELELANERASKAERLLENGKDLGGALKEANERISQVMGDLRNANAQIKDLEEEVIRSDHRIDELEKDLREDKDIISNLEEELHAQGESLDAEKAKYSELEVHIHNLEEEMESAKEYINELEEGATVAVEQIEKLERQVDEGQATIDALRQAEERQAQTVKDLERDVQRGRELVTQTQEALDEVQRKLEADEEEVAELRSKVSALERERDKLYKIVDAAEQVEPSFRAASHIGPTDEELEKLEVELDEANKEIGRLNALLNKSPARQAMDKAKDARIEMLEEEREELLERNKALRMACEATTPHKVANSSMISPIHRHVLSMSMRAPRTPGAPLRDMSWLNSTMNDPTVSPLIAEIHRLQHELDIANESIDDKLDKLEDAGMGVVGLTQRLEEARVKISRLEDEIARLSRKDERYARRLARTRCKKCNVKVDLTHLGADESASYDASSVDGLPSEPPTPPSKTTEALKTQLQAANVSLERLKRDMEDLQASNKRLNTKIRETKEESKKVMESNRAKSDVQSELDRAKRTIADLENALSDERAKLRGIAAEQERTEKDKKHVLSDLRRAESDMDEVRQRLQQLKQENQELEKELRQNSTAEQKVKHLEIKVSENYETISQLRQERSLISKDHKELQKRYSELSETVSKLREKHASHSTSHDNWRHKLDLQVLEIDELKQALEDRGAQLHRAQREKEKIASEKDGVAKGVASLEADLRRVRKDAEAFGRDMKVLKAEKERLERDLKDEAAKGERARKQMATQVKILTEQVEREKGRAERALEVYEGHVCATTDVKQISDLKMQHNKECKGLIVQIRYLKAKFTRESMFREDLTYQKDYLIVLLKQFKTCERNILSAIAKIGFGVAPPSSTASGKRKRTLKGVVMGLMFVYRVKRGSEKWQQARSSRAAVAAALEEVHRKRALAASS